MTFRHLALIAQLLLTLLFAPAAWSDCEPGHVVLQVLGSGGPEMNDKRASSSYLVWIDGKARVLIDAGGGSSLNFEKSGAKIEDLQAVLFTHFHVDHSADFPVFIKASYFTARDHDLPVYGPEGNTLMPSANEFVTSLFEPRGPWRYLGEYIDPEQASDYRLRAQTVHPKRDAITRIELDDTLSLEAVTTHHGPIPALAWRVNTSGCSFTFSGDMSNRNRSLEKLANNTDILVAHNAIPEKAGGVARNLHMPPSEIGLIAHRANIKQLVISHRMKRTLGRKKQTKRFIRKSWKGPLHFANDMDRFNP